MVQGGLKNSRRGTCPLLLVPMLSKVKYCVEIYNFDEKKTSRTKLQMKVSGVGHFFPEILILKKVNIF